MPAMLFEEVKAVVFATQFPHPVEPHVCWPWHQRDLAMGTAFKVGSHGQVFVSKAGLQSW